MKLKDYIKSSLRDTLSKFGFKINKLTEIEKLIRKVKRINDPYLRYKTLTENKNKFSKSPLFYLSLGQTLASLGDPEKYNAYQNYSELRSQWLIDTGLDKFNMEFIPSCRFVGSLGNHGPVEDLIKANHINLRDTKKLFFLRDKNRTLTNKSFFKYFSPHLNVIDDYSLSLRLKDLSSLLELPIHSIVPLRDSCPSFNQASNLIQKAFADNKSKNLFSLSEEDKDNGKKQLMKMGVPNDAWYVTLHAREIGYRGENIKNSYESFRNANIDTYMDSIKLIADSGGWVFRMGDNSMSNLPEIKNCIDYANSEFKSEFMDVYLGATSRFSLVTDSGFIHIPLLFDVPLLYTNCPFFEAFWGLRKNNIYLPRLIKKNNENNYIRFEEFMSMPYGILNHDKLLRKNNIDFIPNTDDEITNATREMIDLTQNLNKIVKLSAKQEKFANLAENKSILYNQSKLTANARISQYLLDKRVDLI